MRSDTNTGIRGRTSFVLIGCERSGKYRARKDLVRIVTGSRKCECLFKLRVKPMVKGEGWMVKLICGSNHNHALAKSLVGHPYVGRLTKDEKIIIFYMTVYGQSKKYSSNIEGAQC